MIPSLLLALSAGAADDKPLFNGKDLAGWTVVQRKPKDRAAANPDPKEVWKVADGEIVCAGKPTGYLATADDHADYVFTLEWRWAAGGKGGNSGVLIHVQKDSDTDWPDSIEAQLKTGTAGDLFLNLPPRTTLTAPADRIDPKSPRRILRMKSDTPVEKPIGEWNRMEITCRGGDVSFRVNDIAANAGTGGSLKKGRIAFQSEGAEIHFRNVTIRPAK